jgi:hypothetical protein
MFGACSSQQYKLQDASLQVTTEGDALGPSSGQADLLGLRQQVQPA